MQEAVNFYKRCVGIEPSDIECKIAKESGCNVINTYFDENFSGRDYSAFIATQVFEHLPNPKMSETILGEGI